MRLLGVGEYGDLGAMYWGLQRAGHEVRVFIGREDCADVYGGMLRTVTHWRAELDWIRAAGDDGVIVFESAVHGEEQDALRREGFQVIGGSAFGDRLEADRAFGQALLAQFGLKVAATHRFDHYDAAIAFLRRHPARYVFKNNGADTPRTRNYIGEMDDARDMLALLALYRAQHRGAEPPDFVLMQHVQGVEVGTGAYFDGTDFLQPACLDWEHKRFFPGDGGELTGEMGTIVTYRDSRRIFDATLARMAPLLREGGYVGYINLNLIANADGLWPVEFTSRFGYPGFAICESLHAEPWDAIFRKMLAGNAQAIATRDGFACGVVLSVPPFPYCEGYAALSKGAPIVFRDGWSEAEQARLHFAEVATVNGQLVTSGSMGYVGCATGTGATVRAAREAAYALAQRVVVPNLRWRNDIGERVESHDLERLRTWGWLLPATAAA